METFEGNTTEKMTSSSGDSAAPLDFHISTSCEDNKLGLPTEYCPLCCKSRRRFYCRVCIKNGNFPHSSSRFSHCPESFSDKKLKFLYYKQEKLNAQQSIEEMMTPHLEMARLEDDIISYTERIRLIKLIIQEKQKTNEEQKEKVRLLAEANQDKKNRLPRYEDRVYKLKNYVKIRLLDCKENKKQLNRVKEMLMRVRKSNIEQLVRYIFPISVVKPTTSHEEDTDTVSALEEACRTAYVQGKWVVTNISSELQHCIVAPTLPSSGDYSAYNDWVAANKDGVPSTNNSIDFNPAYNIIAALTYTTQLVNMLAFYLDIKLPSKLCYSEFCANELSKERFTKRVARLNWNVLHLCLSQNVDPKLLKPQSTLSNILHLLETPELGRTGGCELDPEAARMLEEALRPALEVPSDSEDSEDDSEHLSYEWEAVANVGLPEVEAGPVPNLTSQHQLSSTSVAGGLITSTAASIASLWRGWATNR